MRMHTYIAEQSWCLGIVLIAELPTSITWHKCRRVSSTLSRKSTTSPAAATMLSALEGPDA